MASSLVSTWGWGPQERRRLAEIPDLIAINPHGELLQSGATDYPAKYTGQADAATNFLGNLPGSPEARGIPRGGLSGNLEIALGISREIAR